MREVGPLLAGVWGQRDYREGFAVLAAHNVRQHAPSAHFVRACGSPHLSPCPPPCPLTVPPGVLNRAEWVKFVALFFNQERAASDIFAAIKAEYEATKVGSHHVSLCLRKNRTHGIRWGQVVQPATARLQLPPFPYAHQLHPCSYALQAAATSSTSKKPVVAWASHFSYPGSEWLGCGWAAVGCKAAGRVSTSPGAAASMWCCILPQRPVHWPTPPARPLLYLSNGAPALPGITPGCFCCFVDFMRTMCCLPHSV